MAKSKSFSIRLDEKLLKNLDEYSYKTSQSRTQVIEDAVNFYLLKQYKMSVGNKIEELGKVDRALYDNLLESKDRIERCLDGLFATRMSDQDDKEEE